MSLNKINVTINNQTYTSFESVSINIDMDQFGRAFELTSNIPNTQEISIKIGQSVVIDVDGENILSGYIDTINIAEDEDSSEVSITGRDKVSDFIDSKIEGKTFSTPVGFESILKRLLELVGYQVLSSRNPLRSLLNTENNNTISIINNYGSIQDFQTSEGISFSPSEEAYTLIRRLADKRGLVLGTNGDGNIAINAIAPSSTKTILQRVLKGSSNNIKSANLRDSMANRFNEYKIISGGNKAGILGFDDEKKDPINNDLVQYSSTVYDDEIRPTRKLLGKVNALNNSQCKDRASWESNIRKAKDFSYICKVVGFRQNETDVVGGSVINPLWGTNQLVYLNDQRYNLADDYLIKSISFSQTVKNGSVTELTLVDKNSYTYSLFEPKIKKGIKNKSILSFKKGVV